MSEELWGQYDEGDARDLNVLLAKGKAALSEATKLTSGRYLLTVSQQTIEITVADGQLSFVEVPYGDVSGFHLSCTDVEFLGFDLLGFEVRRGASEVLGCGCGQRGQAFGLLRLLVRSRELIANSR